MLIDLPELWIIILDFVVWFFFHMALSIACMKIPDAWFRTTDKGFKPFAWEKKGEIWNQIFRIRNWKRFLPDGSTIVKTAYNKTNLHGTGVEALQKFIIETKRAELTHWVLIPPAFFFFIWNPPWAGWVMVVYAFIANVPFIIAQRYNRPRLERLVVMLKRREEKKQRTGE